MNDPLKIIIGGDLFPSGTLLPGRKSLPASVAGTRLHQLFMESDIRVMNLECPLTDAGDASRIQKTGPHLKASPGAVDLIKNLNINLLTLANNHIFDYGEAGLKDTFDTLRSHNIHSNGAGSDLRMASATTFYDLKGVKVAFISVAEHEWSFATADKGGANPLDLPLNTIQITEAKKQAAFVFVIIHGGHELYSYPSPRMVEAYRYFASLGVSAVIGHHTHCIGGTEVYNGVPIFYSLGNFYFPCQTSFQGWNRGLVLSFSLHPDLPVQWEIIPVELDTDSLVVDISNEKSRIGSLKMIDEINLVIEDGKRLETEYLKYCALYREEILGLFSGNFWLRNRKTRKVIVKLGLLRLFINMDHLRMVLNHIQCESNLDKSISVLRNFLKS